MSEKKVLKILFLLKSSKFLNKMLLYKVEIINSIIDNNIFCMKIIGFRL